MMKAQGDRMGEDVVAGMAEAIDARRKHVGIAVGAMAAAAGVSRETLRPVLKGYRRAYNDETVFGLARALRWRNDWYDRLKEGLEPVEHVSDMDLAEEVRTLRAEVARLAAQVRRLDTSAGAPPEAGATP